MHIKHHLGKQGEQLDARYILTCLQHIFIVMSLWSVFLAHFHHIQLDSEYVMSSTNKIWFDISDLWETDIEVTRIRGPYNIDKTKIKVSWHVDGAQVRRQGRRGETFNL